MKTTIGDYTFKKHGLIEYPDGRHLYTKKLNIISISIAPIEGRWRVMFITKEALMKISQNITPNLEVIGITFDSFDEATAAHKLISAYYWDELIIQQMVKKSEDT